MPLTVGAGFGIFQPQQRIIPRMKNPLDKSTIVSLLPKRIREVKHTIFPGIFVIEPAPSGSFSTLIVTSSSYWLETTEGQPLLEVPSSSIEVAESVCNDYMNGLLGCNMGDCKPGLFFVPGSYDKKAITEAHGEDPETGIKWSFVERLAIAQANQRRWYAKIVELTDIAWSQTSGSPLAVSEDAKVGAELLGLKDKPWLKDFRSMQMESCPFCGELINLLFPVCKHCHNVINKDKVAALGAK